MAIGMFTPQQLRVSTEIKLCLTIVHNHNMSHTTGRYANPNFMRFQYQNTLAYLL